MYNLDRRRGKGEGLLDRAGYVKMDVEEKPRWALSFAVGVQ